MTASVNVRAARATALYGPGTPAERRELLEMLGVVKPGERQVLPDVAQVLDESVLVAEFNPLNFDIEPSIGPAHFQSASSLAKQTGPCRGSTAPPGLWNPPSTPKPALVAAPKPAAKAAPKPAPPRRVDNRERLDPRQRAPIQHGTMPGYRTHLRYKDKPCDDCRDANREYNRSGYPRRNAQRRSA